MTHGVRGGGVAHGVAPLVRSDPAESARGRAQAQTGRGKGAKYLCNEPSTSMFIAGNVRSPFNRFSARWTQSMKRTLTSNTCSKYRMQRCARSCSLMNCSAYGHVQKQHFRRLQRECMREVGHSPAPWPANGFLCEPCGSYSTTRRSAAPIT